MITRNDYNILKAITDKNDKNKGIIPSNGTTKREIIEITGLSNTKVSTSLKSFLDKGYIDNGLMVKNAKSYILTKKGIMEYLKLKGVLNKEESKW